jgi:hypothetical protein
LESKGAAYYVQGKGQQARRQEAEQPKQAGAAAVSDGTPPPNSIHTLCTGNGSPYQVTNLLPPVPSSSLSRARLEFIAAL